MSLSIACGLLRQHASIASFARVTLQLMALGAPASLLAETQRAAMDEVGGSDDPSSLSAKAFTQ